MASEWFIASRLKLDGSRQRRSPSLAIALAAMSLALVVMILSIVVTTGFKRAIESKIYDLEPHVAVADANLAIAGDSALLDTRDVARAMQGLRNVARIDGWVEKPVLLKTDNDFEVLQLRGVDIGTDNVSKYIVDGNCPAATDTAAVLISAVTARHLSLHAGDRVMAYFVDNRIKARRFTVAGIFDTQFDSFDKSMVIAGEALLQNVCHIAPGRATRVAVSLDDPRDEATPYDIYNALMMHNTMGVNYEVMPVAASHGSFFAWLNMLDMNVAVIIALMLIVSGFTLVSSLLMIVLRRIPTIGLLKALGASNASVRLTFILLTHKLILLAMLIGNTVGIALALIQQQWHVVKLDPAAYYMSSVPIDISPLTLLALNAGFLVVSSLTLIIPSMIISSVKPSTTMRFE